MRLREFNLGLPEEDLRTSRAFRWQVRCVCSLYERCFPSFSTKGAWKVLVECVRKVHRKEPLDQLGVMCQEVAFDPVAFAKRDAHGRKVMALDLLHRGVLRVARSEGWPSEPFEATRKAVVARNYLNEWTWPKPRQSPDRRWKAYLACLHESDSFKAWLVVESNTGIVAAKTLAVKEAPNEFIFVPQLGKVEWSKPGRVALFARDGKELASLKARGSTTVVWEASRRKKR